MHLIATIIALVVLGKAFLIATAVCFIIWLANPSFFNSSHPEIFNPIPRVEVVVPNTNTEKVVVREEDAEEHKLFMQDCMAVMDNDRKYCNDVWFDRATEEDKLAHSGKK